MPHTNFFVKINFRGWGKVFGIKKRIEGLEVLTFLYGTHYVLSPSTPHRTKIYGTPFNRI
jgi:hypothetical protein